MKLKLKTKIRPVLFELISIRWGRDYCYIGLPFVIIVSLFGKMWVWEEVTPERRFK